MTAEDKARVPNAALPVEDRVLLERVLLKTVRPLCLRTAMVREGAAVATLVCPASAPWAAAGIRLRDGIRALTGVALPLVTPEALCAAAWERDNLVAIGNLTASSAYARLYHRFTVCADAGYTGEEGYELRSVHEPFAVGKNVLAIGAQAEAGLAAAVERLLDLCRAAGGGSGALSLPRILQLEFRGAGMRTAPLAALTAVEIETAKAEAEAIYAHPGTERAAAHRLVADAMRYHRTGDEGWFECFRHGILRHIRYTADNDALPDNGFGRYDRDFRDSWAWTFVVVWGLLEAHPRWNDDERLAITNHVLRCVLECNVYKKWIGAERVDRWRHFSGIANNHDTWPGLANLFGGWYFQRHYRLPMAEDWLAVALGMFRGCRVSGKPQEDSAGYQWITLRHVLTYALAAGDPAFIRDGHAADAARAALMCLDNLGHEPGYGDHRNFTETKRLAALLPALEAAVGDGRCRWVLERFGLPHQGDLLEPHHTGTPPARPDDLTGIAVRCLPRPFYDMLGSGAAGFSPPNLPYARTFDKLTLRAGWDAHDDYLLLDGCGAGYHGHQDTGAIIGYTADGAHWLVDGEYIRSLPKYHNAITVLRDGASAPVPPLARLDAAEWSGGRGFCRVTLPDYNGARWTRVLLWLPNACVAVLDELEAVTPGDFTFHCCWRTYGEARLDGDILELRQGDAAFALVNASGDDALAPEFVKAHDGLPIHQVRQRRDARLSAGERVIFANVFGAWKSGARPFSVEAATPGRITIAAGGERHTLGINGFEPVGQVAAAAPAPPPRRQRAARPLPDVPELPVLWRLPVRDIASGRAAILTVACPARLDRGGAAAVVAGTADGTVLAVGTDGQERWRVETGARITALAAGDLDGTGRDSVVFGAVPDRIGRIASDGALLGETRMPAYRDLDSEARNITIADLRGDGEPAIVVGAQSWQYFAFTPALDMRWRHVIYAHAATVAAVADLNGDGKLEIVAGNAYYRLNILDADGQRLVTAGRFGPEQTAVALADLDGDGRPEIVLGTDDGNLHVFDARGKCRWTRNAGDRITGIEPVRLDGKPALAVASASGWVWMLDESGIPRWRRNLGVPVYGLRVAAGGLVAAASRAGVVQLDWRGDWIGGAPLEASVTGIVMLDDRVAALDADGGICAVRQQSHYGHGAT